MISPMVANPVHQAGKEAKVLQSFPNVPIELEQTSEIQNIHSKSGERCSIPLVKNNPEMQNVTHGERKNSSSTSCRATPKKVIAQEGKSSIQNVE